MPTDDLPAQPDGEQLTLRVVRRRDWAVVEARGEIDLATVGDFRTVLEDLMVHGSVKVVVDLAEVSFVDSSALGALVVAHRRARGLGGALAVAAAQPAVARVITLTGLDRVFRLHPTVADAIEG